MTFRTLTASEIEVRVSTVTANGCSLLLYKDARCDMNILDETVGAMNWQRKHSRDNANCTVSIWDKEKQQWIEKEDTGTESYTEKEKGQASDSFKRACVNWGIGRELYTAPFIWVNSDNCTITQIGEGRQAKYTTKDRFKLLEIAYSDDRKIIKLVIQNSKTGKVCYTYGTEKPILEGGEPPKPICVKCGKKIKAAKNGETTISPLEVYEETGGLCLDCYKESNKK